jgi:hypothetical protein
MCRSNVHGKKEPKPPLAYKPGQIIRKKPQRTSRIAEIAPNKSGFFLKNEPKTSQRFVDGKNIALISVQRVSILLFRKFEVNVHFRGGEGAKIRNGRH